LIEIKSLASSSKGNAYHITDGYTPLLLECGLPIKQLQQKLNYRLSDVQGCLITHEHNDHSKAIKDILKLGIDCYMSAGTKEAIGSNHHRLNEIYHSIPFVIGTWKILPFKVFHDAAQPVGYLLANRAGDKLLFATDTYFIRYKFPGLTHIMVECNYSEEILNKNVERGIVPVEMKRRLLRSHFSLENVREFLKVNDLNKVEEIHLLHLSDKNSDQAMFKRDIQGLTGKMVYVP